MGGDRRAALRDSQERREVCFSPHSEYVYIRTLQDLGETCVIFYDILLCVTPQKQMFHNPML